MKELRITDIAGNTVLAKTDGTKFRITVADCCNAHAGVPPYVLLTKAQLQELIHYGKMCMDKDDIK